MELRQESRFRGPLEGEKRARQPSDTSTPLTVLLTADLGRGQLGSRRSRITSPGFRPCGSTTRRLLKRAPNSLCDPSRDPLEVSLDLRNRVFRRVHAPTVVERGQNFRFDLPASFYLYRPMHGGSQRQFSITRAALSPRGRARIQCPVSSTCRLFILLLLLPIWGCKMNDLSDRPHAYTQAEIMGGLATGTLPFAFPLWKSGTPPPPTERQLADLVSNLGNTRCPDELRVSAALDVIEVAGKFPERRPDALAAVNSFLLCLPEDRGSLGAAFCILSGWANEHAVGIGNMKPPAKELVPGLITQLTNKTTAALGKSASAPSYPFSELALTRLREITGQDLGYDAEKWKAWWTDQSTK